MKLSVFVVTYNQEKYIRECLDSILMQKVDFEYEVIIPLIRFLVQYPITKYIIAD